ncbi:twin-arginine translocase TatA/TatE family subunit [Thermodesulfatator autotrophicus]|uniref:Sec-independent protein translocase protein TatA n=1 Tax=Thermodesulfatator autotrophicus TaxID=1795632 RepID=A0A177E7X3_9BACT|nr:twin-arginine translocase TatA/TatE family subunit [Thermodesulfatator autotrophicus]OAG28053.1 preprotein translocase subunit TatA [Thermodesulfatator autotrophicus]
MFGLGSQELLIILLIALVLFGAKRLPEIGAGLGKGIRAFKEGLREGENLEAETKEELEKKKA